MGRETFCQFLLLHFPTVERDGLHNFWFDHVNRVLGYIYVMQRWWFIIEKKINIDFYAISVDLPEKFYNTNYS